MPQTMTCERVLKPATGTARWLQRPDEFLCENGVLAIEGVPYIVSPVRQPGKVRIKDRPIVGWRLCKADGTVYDLTPASPAWQCDCPDWIFNRACAVEPELRECRHCRSLKAALKAVGVDFLTTDGDPTDCRVPSEL
jgi:hypothetical protein